MTNEANIFYEPLRCVSSETKKSTKSIPETINVHVVAMACEEPVKLTKSPRLMVFFLKKN